MASDQQAVLDKLEEVSGQLVLVLGSLQTLQTSAVEMHQRLNDLSGRVTRLESEPPVFRLPQPSLTSEERRVQTDSIRAAVTDQTQQTVPYLERMARASKWTPIALFMGTMAAGFVSALFHSCGGHL